MVVESTNIAGMAEGRYVCMRILKHGTLPATLT